MSAAPVFSAASIAGCIFTVLVSIALPVAALAVLKRKTGRGLLAALVGAGCFIGYALVLEQLLPRGGVLPVSGYYAVSGGLYGLRLPCRGPV